MYSDVLLTADKVLIVRHSYHLFLQSRLLTFPRRSGDMKGHGLNGRGPVWWVPWEEMAAEDCQVQSPELEEMIKALSQELEKHLA